MANKGYYKRKNTLRRKVVEHHILYNYDALGHKQEEVKVPIYNNEHYICRLLQTRGKWISKGFLKTLEHFIWLHKDTAIDLSARKNGVIQGGKR